MSHGRSVNAFLRRMSQHPPSPAELEKMNERAREAALLKTAADRIAELSRSRADDGTRQLVVDLRRASADLSEPDTGEDT